MSAGEAGSTSRNPETSIEGQARDRGRAWSGIAFAALYIAGFVPLGDLLGSFGDSDQTFKVFFASDSNRAGVLLGGLVVALAGLTFLWFLSNLRLSIEGSGPLPGVVSSAGTAFVILLLVGSAALITVPFARIFGEALDTESILVASEPLLPQFGYVLLTVFGMWAAAAMILAVTLAARARSLFPRWLVRLGFATSVFVFLLGPSVMGLLGVPVWALAVGLHWLRGGRSERTASAPVSA